jgi:hypothetical protein
VQRYRVLAGGYGHRQKIRVWPEAAPITVKFMHSKIGAPGLRLGWLRAPADLLRTLVIVKQVAAPHVHCGPGRNSA